MPKGKPRRVPPPSPGQVARIAASAGREHQPFGVAVMVAAYSGLRFNELRLLDWSDLQEVEGAPFARLRVRWGKGENGSGPRPRDAILLPEGLEAVRSLAGYALQVPGAPLLMQVKGRARGKRFGYTTLAKGVRRGRDSAGDDVAGVIFHDLRKFYASMLLNAGVSEMDAAVALGHIDRQGRPNSELVREVYGFVHLGASLDRVAEVMTGGNNTRGVVSEVGGAAARGVGARERDSYGAGGVEEGAEDGREVVARGAGGSGVGVRVDEGVGRSSCDAEGRSRQGGSDPSFALRLAIEDARRAQREAAGGVGGKLAGG